MNAVSIYESIYDNVFCKTFSKSCYVFLCGGADKAHIRNRVRTMLEKRQFRILYPEDLFMEMLNRDKRADLLEYENFLADNADVICVICESMGSAVELGAFVQNENIKKKMVVVINQKYSRYKSFIMMGPVKHLKKSFPERVITYKADELEELGNELFRTFRKMRRTVGDKNSSFDELSSYIAFLPLVVYFYKSIGRKRLHKDLKAFLTLKNELPARYNELFNVAVKYLMKAGILVTEFSQKAEDVTISLSPKGYREVSGTLSLSAASEKTLLHDRIRCDILKEQLNN